MSICGIDVLAKISDLNKCRPGCPCCPVFVSGILEALLRKKEKGEKAKIEVEVPGSINIEDLVECLTKHDQIELLETDYDKKRVKVALKK